MDVREQLAEHLRFAEELGVDGFSHDRAWTARRDTQSEAAADAAGGGAASNEGMPEPVSKPTGSSAASSARGPESAAGPFVQIARSAAEALSAIRLDLGDCTRCKLHTLGRQQIVFGVGNADADLMFVGEAPGYDEDVQGIPFVGRAGQLLTKIIEAIQLSRDDVYIANVIKCRPPQNRNPQPDEVSTCEPFLFSQIDAIKPKVIVALGTFAAQALLRTTDPISRLRGRVYDFRGAKLIPTFHPAYLLRSPERKRDTWEDMKKVREMLSADQTD